MKTESMTLSLQIYGRLPSSSAACPYDAFLGRCQRSRIILTSSSPPSRHQVLISPNHMNIIIMLRNRNPQSVSRCLRRPMDKKSVRRSQMLSRDLGVFSVYFLEKADTLSAECWRSILGKEPVSRRSWTVLGSQKPRSVSKSPAETSQELKVILIRLNHHRQ